MEFLTLFWKSNFQKNSAKKIRNNFLIVFRVIFLKKTVFQLVYLTMPVEYA